MSATSAAKTFEATQFKPTPNNLEAFFMPFTANRQFKANPRLFAKAEGMHYTTTEGRKVIDGTAGLWCVNCGHGREEINEAIAQAARRDGLRAVLPDGPSQGVRAGLAPSPPCCRATSTTSSSRNSGSEAVDTALKIALAYHRANGQGTRTRLIGRERGYHGVGFGGISVGGMVNNRKWFGAAADRRRSPAAHHNLAKNAFSQGPARAWGAHLADELERIVALHDASNIAAVIVEPVRRLDRRAAAAQGLSAERLREICDQARHPADLRRGHHRLRPPRHRLRRRAVRRHPRPDDGAPRASPTATVPMGGVFVRKHIYDGLMNAARRTPSSCSTATPTRPIRWPAPPASAVLDIYRDEELFERVGRAVALLGGGRAFAEGPAQRHRHPQSRPGRRHRPRARRARPARAATRPSSRPSSSA